MRRINGSTRVLTVFTVIVSMLAFATPSEARVVSFTLSELLGRPTDISITVSI